MFRIYPTLQIPKQQQSYSETEELCELLISILQKNLWWRMMTSLESWRLLPYLPSKLSFTLGCKMLNYPSQMSIQLSLVRNGLLHSIFPCRNFTKFQTKGERMEQRILNEQELAEIISLTTFGWNMLGHFIALGCKHDQSSLDINELQRVQFSNPSYMEYFHSSSSTPTCINVLRIVLIWETLLPHKLIFC